ncbi:hypothetical protein E4U57_005222 [Claviceps arundinis]|uniref:Uncharacterized protein n=1 Tax=Claviceps arundinis TaxID=1623583 RepID=A0A9P7N153_9HYPO|nr:hypothetical protein E4U57_005222 [Claviceps arundinis]KAG5977466.1 hypothetical protein E4U56_007769 [Claviceps arundinis]
MPSSISHPPSSTPNLHGLLSKEAPRSYTNPPPAYSPYLRLQHRSCPLNIPPSSTRCHLPVLLGRSSLASLVSTSCHNTNNATNNNNTTSSSSNSTASSTHSQQAPDTDSTEDSDTDTDDSPSGIILRINTSVRISSNNNHVCINETPAQHANAIARAVVHAIQENSAGQCGIPMIDEDGRPRPVRIEVDAGLEVHGEGNVVGHEAFVRDYLRGQRRRQRGRGRQTGVLRRRRWGMGLGAFGDGDEGFGGEDVRRRRWC